MNKTNLDLSHSELKKIDGWREVFLDAIRQDLWVLLDHHRHPLAVGLETHAEPGQLRLQRVFQA